VILFNRVVLVRKFLDRLILIKDVIGLAFLTFYFLYIGFSMSLNKGNNTLNIILLSLTIVHLIIYVVTAFMVENKKVKKVSSKIFKRLKKFIGFVNTLLILVSVVSNPFKSFLTIILATLSILGYMFYVFIDIVSTILVHKVKGIFKKRDNRG
jgi:hypothetical protein